jgi:hypothetical protein
MAQVTGICYVKVNGSVLRTKEGATLDLGGKARTPVVGHEVYGYAEKVQPAVLEAKLAHTADTDLTDIKDWVDATLIFETDTGKQFIVANAFTTDTVKLSAGEGDIDLKMAGAPAEEA